MMIVYRVLPDESFQHLDSTGDEFSGKYAIPSMGKSIAADWVPMRLFVDKPRLPRGDFMSLTDELYACSRQLACRLEPVLKTFGELLPIEIENVQDEYVLWNVTAALDALDQERTIYNVYPTGRGLPKSYAFKRDVVAAPTVFKDRALPGSMLFVSTGDDAAGQATAATNFVGMYRALDLKGLEFTK